MAKRECSAPLFCPLNQFKIAGRHKLSKAEQEIIKSAAGPILK